ncbi:MAG: radical SAM protein [Candidatus Sumerlaeia bacterium]|nr:radical SAM protein [Candidatus Sumerlaeia bacterium]
MNENENLNIKEKRIDIPVLRIVFWETTTGCNLECQHCRRLEISKTLSQNDLTTEEAKILIQSLTEFNKPVLVLSGGEPLLRDDIFELSNFAATHGLTVALATNGTLINSTVAEKIKASGIQRVAVSLDGATPEINDSFRGIKGAFDRAIQGIQNINRLGVPTQINFTLARHNLFQLEAMFELALNLRVNALHLFMLVPVGCGLEIAPAEMLTPVEYESALKNFFQLALKFKELETRATCAPHYYRILCQQHVNEVNTEQAELQKIKSPIQRISRGCLAGINVCFISHRGDVYPCGYLPVPAGNIKETKIKTIWQEAKIFRGLWNYSLLTGKCGICMYKQICGGCRARAYAATGNYLSQEPFCVYQPLRET